MKKLIHECIVDCKPEDVFKICIEVEKWPEIFPPCHATKVLEQSDSHIEFQITADVNDGNTATWVSRRLYDKKDMNISFEQTKVIPPLKSMKGEWSFDQIGDKTNVKLVHIYEADDEHHEMIQRVLDRNSNAELNAIKEYVEKCKNVS